jgi:hypothetical protein
LENLVDLSSSDFISERHFHRLRDRYEAEGAEGLIDRRLAASGPIFLKATPIPSATFSPAAQ